MSKSQGSSWNMGQLLSQLIESTNQTKHQNFRRYSTPWHPHLIKTQTDFLTEDIPSYEDFKRQINATQQN